MATKDNSKKIAFIIVICIIQIVFFIASYDIINFLFRKFYSDYHRSIQWGISVQYFVMWFIALVSIINFLSIVVKNLKIRIALSLLGLVVFSMVISATFASHPLKTTLVFFLAALSFLIPYMFSAVQKPNL